MVNVGRLGELYPKGGDVTISDLVAKGAVRKNEKVKVLADGDLSVKLSVSVDKVSASAKEKSKGWWRGPLATSGSRQPAGIKTT